MMQAHSWNSPHHHTHGGAPPYHHTHGGAPPHHHKHGGTPTTWPNGPVVRTHAGGPVLVASPLPRPPPAWRRARATAQGAALLLLMALLVLSVLPRPLRYQDGHLISTWKTDDEANAHAQWQSRSNFTEYLVNSLKDMSELLKKTPTPIAHLTLAHNKDTTTHSVKVLQWDCKVTHGDVLMSGGMKCHNDKRHLIVPKKGTYSVTARITFHCRNPTVTPTASIMVLSKNYNLPRELVKSYAFGPVTKSTVWTSLFWGLHKLNALDSISVNVSVENVTAKNELTYINVYLLEEEST